MQYQPPLRDMCFVLHEFLDMDFARLLPQAWCHATIARSGVHSLLSLDQVELFI